MKRWSSDLIVLFLSIVLTTGVLTTSAFAWSQSTHAYIAEECLRLNNKYIASYNARMGSTVPDFFWYLTDTGWIDLDTAYLFHGPTEQGCEEGTTYFSNFSAGLLNWWNFRLIYFTKGIKTHVLADVKAHDIRDEDDNGYPDGYVEWWVNILAEKLQEVGDPMADDTEALHLAIEVAIDSLVVYQDTLKLNDLLFAYTQAKFLAKAVQQASIQNGIYLPPNLNFELEFKKYLALMRILEKAASLYAPCLLSGEVDEGLLYLLESDDFLTAEEELSNQALGLYLRVLSVLVYYPALLRQTVEGEFGGLHWENALNEVIDFCRFPDSCN